MLLRSLLLLYSLIGISSTFMPWLYLPKGNAYVYGYLTDGLITGFLFLIIAVLTLLSFRKAKMKLTPIVVSGVIGLLNTYISYDKHVGIENDKANFISDNYFVNLGFAGMDQAIGIYIMGFAGIGTFITALMMLLSSKYSKPIYVKDVDSKENKPNILKFSPIVLPLIFGLVFFLMQNSNNLSSEEIKANLETELESMGNALIVNDYNKFVSFYPDILIQSNGGKEKLIELLQLSINELKAKGSSVKSVEFQDQFDTKINNNNIQSIITQKVVFITADGEKNETQKMLSISDDGGKTWDFVGIDGKSKEEIIKIYPLLNQSLKL